MQLPAVLKPFQKDGEKLLKEGKVKQIEFSGGTYQVQVVDQNKEVWSFLQIDDRNGLKDCFCSCDETEDVSACPHVAAAYLKIFNNSRTPLHRRFEKSLWNKLCYLYSEKMKFNIENFKPSSKGVYAIYSVGGKQIFHVQGKTKVAAAHLKDILFHRHQETEETSLKFSNLSQDEILLWKEGRPSAHLSYELSFWSDLAKWMMALQDEKESYKISFEYSSEGLPNYITIEFEQLECKFYLAEANLPVIIPSLSTVESPLLVYNLSSKNVTKITYEKEEGCLHIDSKEQVQKASSLKEEEKGIRLGSWLFVPKIGFYPLDPLGLLSSKKICGNQISRVLNENLSFIKDHLEGAVIHEEPINTSYTIDFDETWNLHIHCYVFTPGDLNAKGSKFFGGWVYLEDDGFYKLDNLRSKAIDTIIPSEEVADFIQQNRTWLNTHEGFETHLASIEAQMTYKMASMNGPLSFQRSITSDEYSGKSKDFGPWIYIAGQGFYSKVTAHTGLPIRAGVTLNADQIPMFIRMNREELKIIPGFFSEHCPISHAGLEIQLDENDIIHVSPKYDLLPSYADRKVSLFDEFAYVEDEGFSELPVDCRFTIKLSKFCNNRSR